MITMFEEIAEKRMQSLKGYSKLIDKMYIILYMIIFIDSVFLALGYQDIITNTISFLNFSYITSNIVICILSIFAIILIMMKDIRTIQYYFVSFFLIFFTTWAVIESYVLIFESPYTWFIFRVSLNFFISIMLLFRIQFLNLNIKEGI